MFDFIMSLFGLILVGGLVVAVLFLLTLCIPDVLNGIIDAKEAFREFKRRMKE